MNDNVASIRIVGDASGVAPATNMAKNQVVDLSGAINRMSATMSETSSEMVGALRHIQTSLEQTGRDVRQLGDVSAAGFRDMAAQAEHTNATISRFSANLGGLIRTYLSFATGQAIGRLASELGDAAEATQHLSQRLGMALGQVQALQVGAADLGIPMEAIGNGLAQLDRKLALKPETLTELGISIAKGASQMEILTTIAEKFRSTADGPEKVALAMTLMGRAGSQLIPFLNQGAAGLQEMLEKSKEYGAVNERAVEQGLILANSVDTTKYAFAGLKNILTEALGPILVEIVDGTNALIKSMVDSYAAGGAMAVIFQTISAVFEGAKDIVKAYAEGLTDLYATSGDAATWSSVMQAVIDAFVILIKGTINITFAFMLACKSVFESIAGYAIGWWGTLKETFDWVTLALRVVGMTFQTFGKVAADALTLRWGSIAADWDAGMADIQDVVKTRGAQIVDEAKKTADLSRAYLKSAEDDKNRAGALMNKDLKPHHDPKGLERPNGKVHDFVNGPATGGGAGVDFSKVGGGAKTHAPAADKGPTQMQQWKAALSDMLAEEKNWGADSNALSLQFWEQRLGLVKRGSKDELEIRRDISRLKLAMLKDERATEIGDIQQTTAINVEIAKTEIALAKLGVQAKIDALAEAEKAGQVGATKAAQTRATLNRDLYALDVQEEEREYTLKRKGIQDELALGNLMKDQKERLRRQEEMLTVQHLDKVRVANAQNNLRMAKDDAAAANTQRARYRQMFAPFAESLAKMVTAQQGFMATLGQMWSNIQNVAAQAISRMITDWLVGLVTKETASKAAEGPSIIRDAMAAARGAFKAVVGIPIIGPILAPPAAAAAFAAVAAFSAEGGYDVPSNGGAGVDGRGGQFGIVHPSEMILPAGLANPLRNMISNGSTEAPLAAANDRSNNMGDLHVHVSAIDAASFKRFAMDRKGDFAKAVKQYARDGGR